MSYMKISIKFNLFIDLKVKNLIYINRWLMSSKILNQTMVNHHWWSEIGSSFNFVSKSPEIWSTYLEPNLEPNSN